MLKTALKIYEVREQLKVFFGIDKAENVIFTSNCTEALNYAILGSAKKNGHIIITSNEHNSVYRPVNYLKEHCGVEFSIVNTNQDGIISAIDVEKHIRSSTYLVICNHISNVNGDIADVGEIGKLCKSHNILFLVDGAQSAGHVDINLKNQNIDMLAVAGHKGLMGPQGIGVLIINDGVNLSPIKFGGTGTNSIEENMPNSFPEMLEAGTIATPAILGLGAGVVYVGRHIDTIKRKVKETAEYAHKKLSEIKDIIIYTKYNNAKNGVIAFNKVGIDSTMIADLLNEHKICVRAGLHCAPLKHKELGTIETGVVRLSFSHFNTKQEVDKLIRVLSTI